MNEGEDCMDDVKKRVVTTEVEVILVDSFVEGGWDGVEDVMTIGVRYTVVEYFVDITSVDDGKTMKY